MESRVTGRALAGFVSRLFLTSCLALVLVHTGLAGQKDEKGKLQEDISNLKKQVQSLQEGQQQILEELKELRKLLQAKPAEAAAPQQPQFLTLNVHGESFKGDPAASVAIIEYSDFECPFCGVYSRETYTQIVENYVKPGKVKYYFRDLPLPLHSNAMPAARAARCAGEQGKFWEMHDSLFANQAALAGKDFSERAKTLQLDQAKFDECIASGRHADVIRASAAGAQRMGINGTPAFAIGIVTMNGDVIRATSTFVGGASYEDFKVILDELLASQKK